MGGHLRVGAVDGRLVEARLRHAGLEVVRDDLRRDAAEVGKGPAVRADPVGKTPMQTFLDAKPLAQEKMIAA
jgi:hypothetical protein